MRLNYKIFFAVGFMAFSNCANAQLNPPAGQYFFNPYLANPALAGLEKGLTLSTTYRKQFSTTAGGPLVRLLTADYQVNEKLGLGVNVNNESAGLLEQTSVRGIVAYHLPVSNNRFLNFGVGLGFMDEHLDRSGIVGDDDPGAADFNNRGKFIDAAVGMAYHAGDFIVQGAIPNMKEVFTKDDHRNTLDRSLYMTAVSYRFRLRENQGNWFVEPKLAYRGVRGMDGVVDAGVQVGVLGDQLRFVTLYHSSKNASFGFGFQGLKGFGVQALYSTGIRSTVSSLGSSFELNVKLKVFDN